MTTDINMLLRQMNCDLCGSLTLATKEKRCEASKMAYFFVNFSIFSLSNV